VSHFSVAKSAVKPMLRKGWGRIIVTSSILSLHGRAGLSGYCSAKTGLTGLVRVLACEFGDKGIRVNGVGPGFIATDLTSDVRAQPGFSDKVISRTPLGRWGTPADVCVGRHCFSRAMPQILSTVKFCSSMVG